MKKLFAGRFTIDFTSRLITLALVIYLTRILGVVLFGQLAFGLAVVNIGYFLCEFGLPPIFLKEMGQNALPKSPTNAGAYFSAEGKLIWTEFLGLKLVLAFVVFSIFALASPWIWPWSNPLTLVVLFGFMLGNNFLDFFHQPCNAAHKISTSGIIMILHRIIIVGCVLFALSIEKSLFFVAIGLSAGSLLGAMVSLLVILRQLHLPFKIKWMPRVWFRWMKISFPLALANIFSSTYVRLGLIIIPWFWMEKEIGYYAVAHKIFETSYMIPAAIMAISLPKLANSYKNSKPLFKTEITKLSKLIAFLAVLWIVIGELISYPLIRYVFGLEYVPAVPMYRVLIVVNAIVLLNVFLAYLMMIFDLLPKHAKNMGWTTLVCAGVSIGFIKFFGGVGAASALIITEFFFMALTISVLLRNKHKWR